MSHRTCRLKEYGWRQSQGSFLVHQNINILTDCNDISCSFSFNKDEQLCWVSLSHNIFSCTFAERAMRLTPTPLNCFFFNHINLSQLLIQWSNLFSLAKMDQRTVCFVHSCFRILPSSWFNTFKTKKEKGKKHYRRNWRCKSSFIFLPISCSHTKLFPLHMQSPVDSGPTMRTRVGASHERQLMPRYLIHPLLYHRVHMHSIVMQNTVVCRGKGPTLSPKNASDHNKKVNKQGRL